MDCRYRDGRVTTLNLLKIERVRLIGAQNVCAGLARVMAGERLGELASTAESAIAEIRGILAEPPKPMVSK